jgi:CheY-like chemotaxis protein
MSAKKHILVIEDDEFVREFLSLCLGEKGYKVSLAPDGESARKAFGKKTFDLIILDLGLPDMDGLDIAEQIRVISSVPIIVLSARKRREDRLSALGLGADDYITKPCDQEELILRVENVLARATKHPLDDRRSVEERQKKRVMLLGGGGAFVAITAALVFFFWDAIVGPPSGLRGAVAGTHLKLGVSMKCDDGNISLSVSNKGNRWPNFGEVRVYRTSNETVVKKRSLLLARGQTVTFNVDAKMYGSEEMGLWVKPLWYARDFKYDAVINCG